MKSPRLLPYCRAGHLFCSLDIGRALAAFGVRGESGSAACLLLPHASFRTSCTDMKVHAIPSFIPCRVDVTLLCVQGCLKACRAERVPISVTMSWLMVRRRWRLSRANVSVETQTAPLTLRGQWRGVFKGQGGLPRWRLTQIFHEDTHIGLLTKAAQGALLDLAYALAGEVKAGGHLFGCHLGAVDAKEHL